MNLALAKRLALLPLVPLLMAATTLVDPPPLRAPPELTSKEIVKTLQGTLVERGWLLGEQQGDAVDATLHVRSHALTVRFALKEREIHMNYVDSVNLDYHQYRNGRRVIHRKYDQWMRNFMIELARDLQAAAFAKRT